MASEASEGYRMARSSGTIVSFTDNMKYAMTSASPGFFRPEELLMKCNLERRPLHLLADDCMEFYNRPDAYFDDVRRRLEGFVETWDAVCASRRFHRLMQENMFDARFMRSLLLCEVVISDRSNFGYRPPPEAAQYQMRIQAGNESLSMPIHDGHMTTVPPFHTELYYYPRGTPTMANIRRPPVKPVDTAWEPHPLPQSPSVVFAPDSDVAAFAQDPPPSAVRSVLADHLAADSLPSYDAFFEAQINGDPESLALSIVSDDVSIKEETEEESGSDSSDSATPYLSEEPSEAGCDPCSLAREHAVGGVSIAHLQPSHAGRNFTSVLYQNCKRLDIPQVAKPVDPPLSNAVSYSGIKRQCDDADEKKKIKFIKKA